MKLLLSIDGWRAGSLACLGLTFAIGAAASRVVTDGAPAASAVQAAPQQPRHAQADESTSLRQGIVTAVDGPRGRIQVQGMWLDVAAETTKVIRGGRTVGLETLKAGESIRFAVATDASGKRTVRLIYAP